MIRKHNLLCLEWFETMISQSSKVRDLGVIFNQFLNVDDHITATCRSTHFHIRNISKVWNFLSHYICYTIIHAVGLYCNSILYNVPMSKTGRLLKKSHNQCAGITLTQFGKKYISPKFKINISSRIRTTGTSELYPVKIE